jgi:pimeloyl-ACP methyl ester carboxylesterase
MASPEVKNWQWQGYQVRYQTAGDRGSAVILIHGFGGSSGHWRKNIAELATAHRVFAIDLVGFGFSDKPSPKLFDYTFENWANQVLDFAEAVVEDSAFLIGNSIGCIVALQAAVRSPQSCLGVAMLDCSLRLLHEKKRNTLPWIQQVSTPIFQQILGWKPLGHFFFSQVAKPKAVANFLKQAYGNPATVTNELVDVILTPAFEPGAADVFLTFIQYSHGPLAEELLPQMQRPVLILWGEADPWEPIEKARSLANYEAVQAFIPLPGVGHCPQDEAPERVNPLLLDWMQTF